MNETGYDLVAHKRYRHRVINIVRLFSHKQTNGTQVFREAW